MTPDLPTNLTDLRERADSLIAKSRAVAAYSRDHLQRSRNGLAWTAQEDALLGTDSDRAIAEKLGRSTVAVGNRRKKLGIMRTRSA